MELHQFLNQFHELKLEDFEAINRNLKSKFFKKNEIIIQPGQIQRELYFVKSGVQMSYVESEKNTHVIAFTYSPGLCAIPDSFQLQKPSNYYLKCITQSEVDYITFDELQRLFNEYPVIERLFRKMTEAILAGMINRHIDLHTLTIEERYKSFCKRSPKLLQLIPHKYIASYLGIDATNFSRLYNNVTF